MVNSWRINIKICDFMPAIFAKCTKPHFKLIFEPVIMKFIASSEPELRAASCRTLAPLAKHLSDEEQKSKLMGCIKKLASDSVDYVKGIPFPIQCNFRRALWVFASWSRLTS